MTIETFLDGRVILRAGDSRDVLKTLPDCSIDSIVTDPPYALVSIVKRFANSPRSERTENAENPYGRTGRGFMGQRWDTGETAFAVDFWAECLRVLKPGGHVVAFSGTRTVHRMVCAIEDAGFEIRDSLYWHYGSGFPKSHDVSKGIDKGEQRDFAGQKVRYFREAKQWSREKLGNAFGGLGDPAKSVWDWELGGHAPNRKTWLRIKSTLGVTDEEEAEFEREVIGSGKSGPASIAFSRDSSSTFDITAPATDAAREWQGWGTALKPATEPICLARKPLIGTVVANVLEHGTGAINIDGCRVATDEVASIGEASWGGPMKRLSGAPGQEGKLVPRTAPHNQGRWPANIIHDGSEEVLAAFPAEAGGHDPRGHGNGSRPGGFANIGADRGDSRPNGFLYGDSGSAARFFYTAKADADDRLGSKHPTVKPVDLMQWLCRLVTPPGGTILDPFAGTGTTGEAAFRDGFNAVLIEREPEYQADIRRRMALVMSGPDERARESIKAKTKDQPVDPGPLFATPAA